MVQVHGTCIELEGTGILLRGPSGSGKSDLALRLIDEGARLVADDYTEAEVRDGTLLASAPAGIAGLMEVRGVGVIRLEHVVAVPLGLAIDLVPGADIERLPAPATWTCLDIGIALYRLDPFQASAPAKVRLALGIAGGLIKRIPE